MKFVVVDYADNDYACIFRAFFEMSLKCHSCFTDHYHDDLRRLIEFPIVNEMIQEERLSNGEDAAESLRLRIRASSERVCRPWIEENGIDFDFFLIWGKWFKLVYLGFDPEMKKLYGMTFTKKDATSAFREAMRHFKKLINCDGAGVKDIINNCNVYYRSTIRCSNQNNEIVYYTPHGQAFWIQ